MSLIEASVSNQNKIFKICSRSSSPLLTDAMASSSSQLDTSVESTMSDFGLEEQQQRRSTPPEMVIAKFLLQVSEL
jgi:hypothetical protein